MRRLTPNTVFLGLLIEAFTADSPTRRSFDVKDTTEGVVRLPWQGDEDKRCSKEAHSR